MPQKCTDDRYVEEVIEKTTDPVALLRLILEHQDKLSGDPYYRQLQQALFWQAQRLVDIEAAKVSDAPLEIRNPGHTALEEVLHHTLHGDFSTDDPANLRLAVAAAIELTALQERVKELEAQLGQ